MLYDTDDYKVRIQEGLVEENMKERLGVGRHGGESGLVNARD